MPAVFLFALYPLLRRSPPASASLRLLNTSSLRQKGKHGIALGSCHAEHAEPSRFLNGRLEGEVKKNNNTEVKRVLMSHWSEV